MKDELARDKSDVRTEVIDSRELSSLRDRADLFDRIMESPAYVSFYTGYDGQGAAIRQTLVVQRHHMDNVLYNMAMRKAKKLGASSWAVFKPIGVSHNVDYGRYGDESRLDFIDNMADFTIKPKATDPQGDTDD